MNDKNLTDSVLKSAKDLNFDNETIDELETIVKNNYNDEIAKIKQKAAKGGLKFEAYLPSSLAEWVIDLVEKSEFTSPSEAVFVAMQSFRELDENPDVKKLLLQKMLERAEQSLDEGSSVSMEELTARLEKRSEEQHEPAIWKKSMDKLLFPDE